MKEEGFYPSVLNVLVKCTIIVVVYSLQHTFFLFLMNLFHVN